MAREKANLDLGTLAKNIPLTEAETDLVKRRMKASSDADLREEVDRVLDERVGASARGQRQYLTLDEYQDGATTPDAAADIPAPPLGGHLPGEPASGHPGTAAVGGAGDADLAAQVADLQRSLDEKDRELAEARTLLTQATTTADTAGSETASLRQENDTLRAENERLTAELAEATKPPEPSKGK